MSKDPKQSELRVVAALKIQRWFRSIRASEQLRRETFDTKPAKNSARLRGLVKQSQDSDKNIESLALTNKIPSVVKSESQFRNYSDDPSSSALDEEIKR